MMTPLAILDNILPLIPRLNNIINPGSAGKCYINKIQRFQSITRSVFVPLTHLDSVKVSSTDISPLIYHLVSELDQIAETSTQKIQVK